MGGEGFLCILYFFVSSLSITASANSRISKHLTTLIPAEAAWMGVQVTGDRWQVISDRGQILHDACYVTQDLLFNIFRFVGDMFPIECVRKSKSIYLHSYTCQIPIFKKEIILSVSALGLVSKNVWLCFCKTGKWQVIGGEHCAKNSGP